jgi:hypothetical protein
LHQQNSCRRKSSRRHADSDEWGAAHKTLPFKEFDVLTALTGYACSP